MLSRRRGAWWSPRARRAGCSPPRGSRAAARERPYLPGGQGIARCPGIEVAEYVTLMLGLGPPLPPARPLAPCAFHMWEAACSQPGSERPP